MPLWHNELVYDNSGNDIYVKCNPILPDNIEIDEKSNIIVSSEQNINDIWNIDSFIINVGKTQFYIKRETLRLKEYQTIIFTRQGISRINTKNIYDITNKSDVLITIKLKI